MLSRHQPLGRGIQRRGARINTDYTYPSQKIIDYFASKKLNTVRLPILWERLQPVLNQPLDPDELGRLKVSVEQMRKAGLGVIIDPHNFATYNDIQIGTRVVSYSDFADFWRRVAQEFGNRDGIYFGLMNEPFHMPATQWLRARKPPSTPSARLARRTSSSCPALNGRQRGNGRRPALPR